MSVRVAAALALVAAVLAGCSGSDDHGETVVAKDDAFDPAFLHVTPGTEVHFEVDPAAKNPHNIRIHQSTAGPTEFRLDKDVEAGDDTHFTFEQTGTYHVYCKYHGTPTSGMHMDVHVE